MTDSADRENDGWQSWNEGWDDFDRLFASDFEAMNRRLDRMFTDLAGKPGVRTYGYTMYRGPDGIPHVQEFGNSHGDQGLLVGSPAEKIREPLTDVSLDGDVVRATAEIPGIEKSDIQLDGSPTALTITVDTAHRQFCKTLPLPCAVDPDSAQAEYNNGILEVTLKAVHPAEAKKRIRIE